jgi:transglycosylase-like protein
VALITLAAPATALAAHPYKDKDLSPTPVLDKSLIAHQRAHRAQRHAARAAAPAAIPGYLAAIAACESGGNPSAIGGGGLYRGMFQMTYSAWASVGGSGDPAAAPVAEQVRRAAALYAQAGPGQWPVCGQ